VSTHSAAEPSALFGTGVDDQTMVPPHIARRKLRKAPTALDNPHTETGDTR
jgi:hypothetical protein